MSDYLHRLWNDHPLLRWASGIFTMFVGFVIGAPAVALITLRELVWPILVQPGWWPVNIAEAVGVGIFAVMIVWQTVIPVWKSLFRVIIAARHKMKD